MYFDTRLQRGLERVATGPTSVKDLKDEVGDDYYDDMKNRKLIDDSGGSVTITRTGKGILDEIKKTQAKNSN